MEHSSPTEPTAPGSSSGGLVPGEDARPSSFPLGCRHNTFLTEGDTRNVSKLPGTQDVPGKEQGKYQGFFLTENVRILQESYYRQKGTKT